jgi:hypothetical protein
MTGITRDDVRAAVASGTMTEAQAASLSCWPKNVRGAGASDRPR